ncbi:Hsp90 co-chaperone Cdc37 [Colletotrichum chlorophyti]|uniref:Hsp90 chaperone protein kinase-targeting subunit n=1 Tax=Colletotrichum chlorophyti TaxID=708187 RepID=A0A1Q8S012_9PEZI|nr:Hsp90 co-chaperone Cdc37 [Colletotrichum chlorophyti]
MAKTRQPTGMVQFMSDIHLEVSGDYSTFDFPVAAPYLLLSGDVGSLADYDAYLGFIRRQTERYTGGVLLVLGNHEFHGLGFDEGLALAGKLEQEPSLKGKLHVLHRRRFDIPDAPVTIVGCTLWTSVPGEAEEAVVGRVKDFRHISGWSVARHNEANEADLRWLKQEIGELPGEREVVIATHHAPCHEGTSEERHRGSPWSSAFATDVVGDGKDWGRVSRWVFGHTHFCTDVVVNGVRIDALELSDDSDVEVHPNVDKRSFIRAKQNQIHQERLQRKHQIETLKYERIINDGLMKRISALLDALKAHASDAETRNPGEVAFRAVMESAGKPEDDQPPPRPEGIHTESEPLPTFSKMMAVLLDQVNKELDEKKPENRYQAMLEGVEGHLTKVQNLQKELLAKLAELEKEEGRKITSESIHTGFDSSHVNKSKGTETKDERKPELLNPNFNMNQSLPAKSTTSYDDDEEIEASPTAKQFSKIKADDYSSSSAFLSKNPQILTERETDGLLVLAFDAALEGRDDESRNCVHQALLLQYCRALGKDGVGLFFKRITTKGHQAQEVFYKDVQDTYGKIRNRAREIVAERAKEPEGVEQIQLHAVEPGTEIKITIPPKDSEDPAVKQGREIFEGFSPEFQKALESGSLDKVNEVLGKMKVDEAEDIVGKLGDAGILSLEEQIIDATTEEGQKALKDMEAAAGSESGFAPDPE